MVPLLLVSRIVTLGVTGEGLTTALLGQPVVVLLTVGGAEVGVEPVEPVLEPEPVFVPQAASTKASIRTIGTMNKIV